MHLQKPYCNVEMANMAVTDKIWKGILTLPSSTGITDKQLEYVVSVIKDILQY